jgi:hypothetical protein
MQLKKGEKMEKKSRFLAKQPNRKQAPKGDKSTISARLDVRSINDSFHFTGNNLDPFFLPMP